MLIAGLIIGALVLIFWEVLLPGGLLGLLAAGCIVAATALAIQDYGLWVGGGLFVGTVVFALLMTILEFKWFAQTQYGKRFFLGRSVEGHSNVCKADASIIGQSGTTLTRLNPSGRVLVDGQSYEAISQDGYIEAQQAIRVVSQDSFKLIIQKS
ncbi:MAG: NfeD family protein [Opitutales bacterium]|jgi:membrane-bound serine protease (ClpP class)